jgi:hypothetical protein
MHVNLKFIAGLFVAFTLFLASLACGGSSYTPPPDNSNDQSAPDVDFQATISALETQAAQKAEATSTPLPILPTATPSITPIPDTPPGTILEVGQSWLQSGWEVGLVNPVMVVDGFDVGFFINNWKAQAVVVRYSLGGVSAVDNRGQALEVKCYAQVTNWDTLETCGGFEEVKIDSGNGIYFSSGYLRYGNAVYSRHIAATLSSPYLTEIIVTVTGLPDNIVAQWRIPVPH